MITAFQTLMHRVETGRWGSLASATLNEQARALGSYLNVFEGQDTAPAFVRFSPPVYLRPFAGLRH